MYYFDELSKVRDGEWVCFPEFGDRHYAFAVVKNLRAGRWELPEGEWEFRAEGSKVKGKSWVYARRVGCKPSQLPEVFDQEKN